MSQQRATHDLSKAEIGDEYEPVEVTVTEEMVERRLWANDDYNPWYLEDSPFGGRIASPIILLEPSWGFEPPMPSMVWGYYRFPPGGALHGRAEFEFINPLKVGKKIKITARLVDKFHLRERDWFVSEYLAVDEDGVEVVRMRRTEVTPIVIQPQG